MITLGKISKMDKQLALSIKLTSDSCIMLRRLITSPQLNVDEYNICIVESLLKELELAEAFSKQMDIAFAANKIYVFTYDSKTALLIVTNHQIIIDAIYKVDTDSEKE